MADADMTSTDVAARLEAPVDLDHALMLLDGDRELLLEILDIFREDGSGRRRELDEAMRAGDAVAAHRVAHTLKGSAAALGARDLQERARRLEHLVREGDLAAAGAAWTALQHELERVLRYLATDAGPAGRRSP